MNHCYRLVFNRSTQVWQVVSEIAKSHSKSVAIVLLPLFSLVNQSVTWAEPAINALPSGGQVVAGQSAITQNGNQLNIVQSTEKSIINWQSYNIGSNAEVNYIQNNANAISVNRVVTGDPSAIFGKLNSNGQVWLINPNGVLFGQGAQVNVGGLLASTLNIADDDFMSGKYQFTGSTGSVVNMGAITASQGGYVAMLAPEVRNEGVISAMQGTVAMAAGNAMTLDFNGGGLVNVQVDSASVNTLVENKHLIQVGNGQVLMSTKAADGLITSVINNSGKIEANSMVSDGGVIRLTGAKTVINSGDISATSANQKGGTLHLLGDNVGMFSAGSVNVSGKTGGGTILVGGDFQGKNPSIQNATKTYVSKDAKLIADATESGDGGKVIVWADDITRYYGSTSAKGGAVAGNGGFVEISGKRLLNFLGSVDLSAANGVGGNLLLDPENITIGTGLDTNTLGFTAPASLDITEAFADDAGLNSFFDVTALTGSFFGVTAGSTITLQANNDITIANAFDVAAATGSANNSLVLEANNNINVNAALSVTGTGSLTLKADADNSGTGNLAVGAAIATDIGGANLSGVNVTGVAAGTINTTGATNSNSGNLNITATDSINLAGAITTSGVNVTGSNAGLNAGNVSLIAGKSITTSGITATGSSGAANFSGGNGGSVSAMANTGITIVTIQNNGGNANTIGNGGYAGDITLRNQDMGLNLATNNVVVSGNIIARAGSAAGTGAGGSAASINIHNQADSGNVLLSNISAFGQVKGNGANVNISSEAGVTVATINTVGGSTIADNAGQHAGSVTISGVNRTVGAISANGGAGAGTNQAGGNAGVVSITGTGTLNTSTIDARTGSATGTGASGLVGSVSLTGSDITAAAINTTGQANGNGGTITATATGLLTLNGAISSSGGTPNADAAGANAGAISLTGNTINAVNATITATGTNALGVDQAGGNGAVVTLNAAGNISTRDIIATGGSGAATNAKGGNAGSISITTSAGDITTNGFDLDARSGAGFGTGANSVAGFININNTSASGAITTASLNTSGNANGNGGNVSVTGNGTVTVGTVTASSGATTGTRAGLNAGNVTITGAARAVGTILANGGTGSGTSQNGGNGGVVSITGAGTLSTAAITANGGNGTTTNAKGGNAGSITLATSVGNLSTTGALIARTGLGRGTGADSTQGFVSVTNTSAAGTVSVNAVDTRGQTNGHGGNLTIAGNAAVTVTNAIQTSGGDATGTRSGRNGGAVAITGGTVTTNTINSRANTAVGVNQTGGNAGAVSLTATTGAITTLAITANGGNGSTINGNGGNGGNVVLNAAAGSIISMSNITTTGGNRAGTGSAGAGGNITIADNAVLSANATLTSSGGSAGVGAGGAINFNGTLNSIGASRTLTINNNAATTFAGAVGNSLALASITTNATGSTVVNGGSVTTTGVQTYNDAVTLGAATTFTTTNSNVNFANSVNANGNNIVVAAGTGAFTATNAANNFGNLAVTAGSANVRDVNAIVLGATNVTGAYTLQTAGNITQTAAAVIGGASTFNASSLADITLNNTSNNFNSVAITSANNVSLVDSNALTIGASAVNSITARTLTSDLTLGGNIAASATGDAVVLASAANFLNPGSSTLSTPSGRWLIYANTHTGNTFGGLISGNQAIYGRSFPTATTETGNRYVFANSPTLNITSTNQTKTYGQDASAAVATAFTASTFVDASAFGGVFTQDTIANSLTGSATSAGSATTANTGNYAIDVTPVTAINGYTLNKSSAGNLTVDAAVVNLAGSRAYDGTTVFDASAFSTFATGVNGETLNVTGSGGSVASKNAGAAQALTTGGLALANGTGLATNYTLVTGTHTGTISAAALNLNAVTDSKTYDGNTTSSATVATVGLAIGDTITGLNQSFASKNVLGAGNSTLNVNAGYTVNDGNGGNNYTVTTNTATGTISVATLNLNAVTDSKTYDGNTTSLVTVATTGLVGGDTISGLTQSFASKNVLGLNGSTLNVNAGYTVNDGNGGNNYFVAAPSSALGTITEASLSITANNASKVQGSANPAFTSTISGFVGGETSAVLAGTLDYSTLADAASPVGTYTVTPFGVSSNNYAISFVDGALDVTALVAPPLPPVTPPSNALSGDNISVFNNATTRPEQAVQTCNQQGANTAMINGLDEFGLDDVDYKSSISQPQVGGVIANGLAGVSCSIL